MGDAADRREARRRRILENSENRLRIISGLTKVGDLDEDVKNDGQDAPMPIERETKPTPVKCEASSNSPLPNDYQFSPPEEVQDSLPSSKHDNYVGEPVIPLISESVETSLSQSELPKSIIYTLFEARLYLVGLAIIVRLLLSSNHGYLFGDSIFVPLFTIQLVKYFGTTPNPNNSVGGIISGALMLCGLSSLQINLLNKILGSVKDFLTDFNIYFITFIMTHVLLEIAF